MRGWWRAGASFCSAMLVLAGCRELNPDFAGAAVETDATTSGSSSSSSSGSESSSSSSESSGSPMSTSGSETSGTPGECGNGDIDPGEDCDGDAIEGSCSDLGEPGGALACNDDCTFDASGCACGVSRPASGGECPSECTSCEDDTCVFTCAGDGACEGAEIACPAGWDCVVACEGDASCAGASIACGAEACTLTCDGRDACSGVAIDCTEGACEVACGFSQNVCEGLEMDCGPNDSVVTCSHQLDEVAVVPIDDSSCACEAIDC